MTASPRFWEGYRRWSESGDPDAECPYDAIDHVHEFYAGWRQAQAEHDKRQRALRRAQRSGVCAPDAGPDGPGTTSSEAMKPPSQLAGGAAEASPAFSRGSDSEDDMAKTLDKQTAANGNGNAEGRGTTASHNAHNRQQAIRDALEDLYQTDVKIEALMERHIQPLRDHKRDVKKRMKEHFDVPTKRFNARYSQYREERRALAIDDQAALDAIRELYDVAPVGQQMDGLHAVEEGAAQPSA